MWKIGKVEIANQVVLAPMAGVGDSAFRRIIKEMGCGLLTCEMVSDKAITYGDQKTIDMLYMTKEERPIAQQIFGSDEASFVKAAQYIEKYMQPDIIDINMGCPVPKIALKSQAGSALLKDPAKVKAIVAAVVKAVKVPVTVKIRSGWDSNHINAVEIAKLCEEAGARAITVHPRTRAQGYSGQADWRLIKEVKANVNIPVIGNGDIKSCYDAKRMIMETGCDAVMIGRGTLGNPWLIKECIAYLSDGTLPKPVTKEERLAMIVKHMNYLLAFKSEKRAILELRSQAAWYLKGIPHSNQYKQIFFKATTKEQVMAIITEMRQANDTN